MHLRPLQHQADFDVVWAKGTVGELIFKPWVQRIQDLGATLLTGKRCVRLEEEEEDDE